MQLLVNHLEPLTEQQLSGISNLQQSSQQAEDALSQGMEALQQSLSETLVGGSPGPAGSSENVANYMGQMAMAMGKLGTLESFLRQVYSFIKFIRLICILILCSYLTLFLFTKISRSGLCHDGPSKYFMFTTSLKFI